jgi:hypothetical protein
MVSAPSDLAVNSIALNWARAVEQRLGVAVIAADVTDQEAARRIHPSSAPWSWC